MIFKKEGNGNLQLVKNVGFKLEKEIQTLVEENMETVFGLRFLETEFSIGKFRFDSVAFDEEANTFVIIEDKKVENRGLVDQGYAYLKTALDRKAELTLLYNRKMRENRGIQDFAWDEMKVYFISPEFTKFQKEAVGYDGTPFRLFTISQYRGGIIDFEEIVGDKIQENLSEIGGKSSDIKEVSREIKVYTEEYHLENADDTRRELYSALKERATELGTFEIVPRKLYVAFKLNNKNIFDVELQKKKLVIFINLSSGELDGKYDSSKLYVKDVSNQGHWGNGDYEVLLESKDQLDYLMPLIRESFRKNS